MMKIKVFKRVTATALAILMVASAVPENAFDFVRVTASAAQEEVSYTAYSFNTETDTLSSETVTVSDYTLVTPNLIKNSPGGLMSGTYVVKSDTVISEYVYIRKNQTVNLVIMDSATLTCSQGIGCGIDKNDESATLNIYGDGILVANGTSKTAGIGGKNDESNGNITIHGTTVVANGGKHGAGIGGGEGGKTGSSATSIKIYAGDITAKGGTDGAGIGGGDCQKGSLIYIYSGTVKATGGKHGAGIGGGDEEGVVGFINYNGTITAKGGYHGAGIGAGEEGGSIGKIEIRGGDTTAIGGEGAAGIGGGYDEDVSGEIKITGETTRLYAEGGEHSAGIGGGYGGGWSPDGDMKGDVTIDCGVLSDIRILGGTRVIDRFGGAGIGGGVAGNLQGNVYIYGGNIDITSGNGGAGIGGGREETHFGGEGGTVYIGGGNTRIHLFNLIQSQDFENHLDSEAIGAGHADWVSGTVYISADNNKTGKYMRVDYAKPMTDDFDTAKAGDRSSYCHGYVDLYITECNHKNYNGKSGLSYTVNNDTHDVKCKYCGYKATETHFDGAECICGYTNSGFDSVSVQVASEDSSVPYMDLYMMKKGSEFQLPECENVPDNKRFMAWKKDGSEESYYPYDTYVADANTVFEAVYADLHKITRPSDTDIPNGTMVISAYEADTDDAIIINTTADAGYMLESVTVRENNSKGDIIDELAVIPGQTSVTLFMPDYDIYVSPVFVPAEYTVYVSDEYDGGSVSLIGPGVYEYSDFESAAPEVYMTVTPDEGWHLSDIYGEVYDPVEDYTHFIDIVQTDGNMYSLKMPKSNVKVVAVFEENEYADVEHCTIKNASVTLGGELALNFYVQLPKSVAEEGALIVLDGPWGEKEYDVSALNPDEEGSLKVSYGLKAIYADQKVDFKVTELSGNTLDLYKTTGEQVTGNVLEYGIYDYVNTVRSTPDIPEEYVDIVNAMYTYCAYSVTWKYGKDLPEDVDKLPETGISTFEKYAISESGSADAIVLTGASLILYSNMAFRLYFTVEDDAEAHKVLLGSTELAIQPTSEAGKYYVDIEDIPAHMLRENYTLNFDGTYDVTVSCMTYIYNFYKNGVADENLEKLLRAIYAYSTSIIPDTDL